MTIRVLLFLSSYTPLWIILAFRFWWSWSALACIVLAIVGLAGLLGWMLYCRRQSPGEYIVQSVEDAGAEAAGYLASYLLPFFNVVVPGWRDIVAYVGFFLTAGAIYVRSNILRINPTLYLMGYWVLQVEDVSGKSHYLITRERVRADTRFEAVDLRGGVLLLTKVMDPIFG